MDMKLKEKSLVLIKKLMAAVLAVLVIAASIQLQVMAKENSAAAFAQSEKSEAIGTFAQVGKGETSSALESETTETSALEIESEMAEEEAATDYKEDSSKGVYYNTALGITINSTVPEGLKEYDFSIKKGSGKIVSFDFPYADDLFKNPENEYNRYLARCSMAMVIASLRSVNMNYFNHDTIDSFFEMIGFENICADPFLSEPTADSATYAIASKKIGDMTVIASVCCGEGYKKEWCGNLEVGNEERHTGFNKGAQKVEKAIEQYIEDNSISGEIVIWTTGFSRAAAIANIVAADMTDNEKISRVYAYCFATPNTTREPKDYDNIFNTIGKNDPVARVPFSEWGYTKYGKILYTPSIETNSDYKYRELFAALKYHELYATTFMSNAEINKQMRGFFGYLNQIIPDADTYEKYYQQALMNVMYQKDAEVSLNAIATVVTNIAHEQKVDSSLIVSFTEYVEKIASQYVLQGNESQKETGIWNEEIGVGLNVVREHDPILYMSWLYSDLGTDYYLDKKLEYQNMIIRGDVSVTIIDETGESETIQTNQENKNYYLEGNLYFEVGKDELIITIPKDEFYYLNVKSLKNQEVTLIRNNCVCNEMNTTVDLNKAFELDEGEELGILLNDEAVYVEDENGMVEYSSEYFSLTPAEIVKLQQSNIPTFSIVNFSLQFILYTVILGLEIILSIILGIIRAIRKKKRRKIPTLVWHLFNGVIFMISVMYMKYYVPAFPVAALLPRVVSHAALLVLIVKALKIFKNKKLQLMGLVALIAMIVEDAVMYFVLTKYTLMSAIIEWVIFCVLCVLAGYIWCNAKNERKKMDESISDKETKEEEDLLEC